MSDIKLQPKTWWKVKLGDMGRVVTGTTPPTVQKDYFGKDFPFITPTDITDFNIRYNYKTERFLSNKWGKVAKKILVPQNSVCFVCIGSTIGKICLTREDSFTNQQINTIVADSEKADFKYIYYLLKKNQGSIIKQYGGGGSGKAIINKSTFENIEFLIPNDINEQKRIADILSAFDDKIELNNKINQSLEQMAQRIFREWFVKLKFPGYEKVKMINSELGKIPERWGIDELKNIIEIKDGRNLVLSERKEKGRFAIFGANGIMGFTDKILINEPIVILGKIGSCGTIHRSFEPCWVSNNAFIIKGGNLNSLEFAHCLLKRMDFSQYIGGSANPYMPKENFFGIRTIKPSKDVVVRFENKVNLFYKLIIKNQKENQKLSSLRDLLLPKLMGGDVKI